MSHGSNLRKKEFSATLPLSTKQGQNYRNGPKNDDDDGVVEQLAVQNYDDDDVNDDEDDDDDDVVEQLAVQNDRLVKVGRLIDCSSSPAKANALNPVVTMMIMIVMMIMIMITISY